MDQKNATAIESYDKSFVAKQTKKLEPLLYTNRLIRVTCTSEIDLLNYASNEKLFNTKVVWF